MTLAILCPLALFLIGIPAAFFVYAMCKVASMADDAREEALLRELDKRR